MLQNCPFHKITHQCMLTSLCTLICSLICTSKLMITIWLQKKETPVVYSNWKLNIITLVRQSKPTNKFPIEKTSNFTMCIYLFERLIISNSNSNFKITMETHNSNKFEKSVEPKLLFQICISDVQIQESYQNSQFNL